MKEEFLEISEKVSHQKSFDCTKENDVNSQANKREQRRLYQRHYYEENRIRICKYFLRNYVPDKINRIHSLIPDKVADYYTRFPYEQSGLPVIQRTLYRFHIFSNSMAYQECVDAGTEAYIFGIHQCAFLDYKFVDAYIRKITPIFINNELNIYSEDKEIHKETGLSVIRLDGREDL